MPSESNNGRMFKQSLLYLKSNTEDKSLASSAVCAFMILCVCCFHYGRKNSDTCKDVLQKKNDDKHVAQCGKDKGELCLST